MLRRHCVRTAACAGVTFTSAVAGATLRSYHMPGWKTQSSTKDTRSRQQREADRKIRQIEKLPRPEALHDFQYPYEKTVLSDYMFQYPVYENELDTPHLFNLTPPPDFFLYWNVMDFERTAYPPVPELDHRLLVPSASSPHWQEHRIRLSKYLQKHEVSPNYIPQNHANVNLSVVFPGKYRTRAVLDEETGKAPVDSPETCLRKRNFWFTAHCGNYVELADLQQPPAVFFLEDDSVTAEAEPFYTLMIISPDYPFRVPSYVDRSRPDDGFFLHYMVANLPGGRRAGPAEGSVVDGTVVTGGLEGFSKQGDVVIPYVPPLPTEDAGTARYICVLLKQAAKVPVTPLSAEAEEAHFPLVARSQFCLHDPAREGDEQPACLASLRAVERVVPKEASAVTFFQTKWDIQVQEFYERVNLPEPAAPVDEEIEALLEFHVHRPEELRVRARHRADGSTNMGDDPNFWGQMTPTRTMDGSMQSLWSRRTAVGSNGVPVVYPH